MDLSKLNLNELIKLEKNVKERISQIKTKKENNELLCSLFGKQVKWEMAFNKMWEQDDEDKEPMANLDYKILKEHLESVIEVVNTSKFDLQAWLKFKMELIRLEEEDWGCSVFLWSAIPTLTGNVVFRLDVDWNKLENDSKRYFLVEMAIQGCWKSVV